ncbi:metallophosphoesterase [bacterium]|nr:metallophosphoesterase [bacterium]
MTADQELCTAFLEAMKQGKRPDGGFQDGAVVDLLAPSAPPRLYLVGDVHARAARIHEVFRHANLHQQLAQKQAVVVFLGDLFHREEYERAGEMDSSLDTFRLMMSLKVAYPRHFYVLLGNHEFTRTLRCKHGYFQGILFGKALERAGLRSTYEAFVRESPLVVIHPQAVGVHAAPSRSLGNLDQLKEVPVADLEQSSLHPAVIELTCDRHIKWSPQAKKAYTDYDVERFLELCGVPQGHLFTGHTPLSRETGWEWTMGPRNTVIFAAGRELGYACVQPQSIQLVRVGRSSEEAQDEILTSQAGGDWHGMRQFQLWESEDEELVQDRLYRFSYQNRPVRIAGAREEPLDIRSYRHLPPAAQNYYGAGYFLLGQEHRSEVLALRRDQRIVLGGFGLCQGVRFFWPEHELALLGQLEDGEFELRPLVAGLRLQRI